jgi:branched-chain amino acid aminotransferase
MTIYLNGEYIRARGQAAECAVSFAGGVFETMRAYGGRVFKLSEHIKRLFMSAKFLGMSISYTSEELEEICCKVLEDAGLKSAQVRISIKDKMRNLISSDEDLLIIVRQLPHILHEKDRAIITSSLVKQPPLPQAKSSDFLSGVLARAESYVNNPSETVFLNHYGYVTEGTVSNIFIVRDRVVITPPVYLGLLNGITRQCVIEIAMQTGIKTIQMPFTRYDLWTADEVFLTNSTIEILPVSIVDGRKIGNSNYSSLKSRGDVITSVLQEGYRQMVNR